MKIKAGPLTIDVLGSVNCHVSQDQVTLTRPRTDSLIATLPMYRDIAILPDDELVAQVRMFTDRLAACRGRVWGSETAEALRELKIELRRYDASRRRWKPRA